MEPFNLAQTLTASFNLVFKIWFIFQNFAELIEKAVHEHDAEGTFYDIVKFLLQTFLSVSKEENEEEANDDESSNGTATPDEPEAEQEQEEEKQHGHVSSNATAAAAWPMLHQGMALDELTIDPFTLSEILRLHILSSGVRIGKLDDTGCYHCQATKLSKYRDCY